MMTELKKLAETLLKNRKLLAYFLIFWAAVLIFYGIGNHVEYDGRILEGTEYTAYVLASTADVAAGVVLALLAIKLLKENFLSSISKKKLLAVFLLLWAASFIFWGLSTIIDYGRWALEGYTEDVGSVVSGVIQVGAAIPLALLSIKLLKPNFISSVSRNKLLVIFLVLWAGTLFFWGLSNVMRYGNDVLEVYEDPYIDEEGFTGAISVVGILYGLADMGAGIVLALLATKLWGKNLPVSSTKTKLLAVFLLFWAASFFFAGLYDILDWAPIATEYAEAALTTIAGLMELAAAAMLAMLGIKTWSQKEVT
jgi:hypothetical protein